MLTGVSACEPPEGNILSYAIVRSIKFIDDDDFDHIAYTPHDKVKSVVEELRKVKIDMTEFFNNNYIHIKVWEKSSL